MNLRPLPARKIIKVLSILGVRTTRRRGSHVVLKHPDGRIDRSMKNIRVKNRPNFEETSKLIETEVDYSNDLE